MTKKNIIIALVICLALAWSILGSLWALKIIKVNDFSKLVPFLSTLKNNKEVSFSELNRKRTLKAEEILVSITNKGFSPNNIGVSSQSKTIVIFRNFDKIPHMITTKYPDFKSPQIQPESEFSFVFVEKGVWPLGLSNQAKAQALITVQ